MAQFGFIDRLWVILYLILMTGCGVLFYRLGERSESDFFLAGRAGNQVQRVMVTQ